MKQFINDPNMRPRTVLFVIWKEASGRRKLGEEIWGETSEEAYRRRHLGRCIRVDISGTILVRLGISWDHLGSPGIAWDHLGSSGIFWVHLGSSGIIWDHRTAYMC